MSKKAKLYRGDVLEVLLDNEGNKGYMVLLAVHTTRKVPLFGMVAIKPCPQGYGLEKLKEFSYVARRMVFVDPKWSKIGKLVLPDNFVWPDLYHVSILKPKGKTFVYRYGEDEPYKELNEGEDLGNAVSSDVSFPGAALFHYRQALRKHNLYNKPEPLPKSPVPVTEVEEMSYAGIYGDVWLYYQAQINDKKKSIKIATQETIQKFSDELSCSDTALQLYMGIAKAQLEFNDVLPEIKEEVLKRIREEEDYLSSEKWLSNQADKIREALLKLKSE